MPFVPFVPSSMSGVGFLQYLEKGAANSSSSSVSSAGAPATTQGSAKESPRGHADTSRVSAPAARESITHRLAAKDVELLFSSLCSKKVNGIEVSHLYSVRSLPAASLRLRAPPDDASCASLALSRRHSSPTVFAARTHESRRWPTSSRTRM